MGNLLALSQLALQGLSQLQSYQLTMQKAIGEGRDVSTDDLVAASASLQGHLDQLQSVINASKGKTP